MNMENGLIISLAVRQVETNGSYLKGTARQQVITAQSHLEDSYKAHELHDEEKYRQHMQDAIDVLGKVILQGRYAKSKSPLESLAMGSLREVYSKLDRMLHEPSHSL